jgi:hypothetical protein
LAFNEKKSATHHDQIKERLNAGKRDGRYQPIFIATNRGCSLCSGLRRRIRQSRYREQLPRVGGGDHRYDGARARLAFMFRWVERLGPSTRQWLPP